MSFFSKLFGRNKQSRAAEAPTARHRSGPEYGGEGVPAMREPSEGYAPVGERPLFRDQSGGYGGAPTPGGRGAGRIDPEAVPSAAGGGFGPSPSASQEAASVTVCTRCGNRNAEGSRFCSNCGAPLHAGYTAERPSETTSTISISGLEAYEPDAATTQGVPVLPPEAQAAVDALPPGSALLIVSRGPNSGSRFLLDSDVTTAGRHPESDIFLDDVTVSRRHVEFRRSPAGFTVADVGSLNGTYVNRERIDEVPLSNGDEVQIGKYRMVFFASRQGY